MSTSPTAGQELESALSPMDALRLQHKVRPLQAHEEGCALGSLPNGVYGYSYAPGQDEVPVFSKRAFHSFEIHKAADGAQYLTGFVTAREAKELQAENHGATIQLFPDPWESSDCLVSVPISRVALARRLPREPGNPLPVTLA